MKVLRRVADLIVYLGNVGGGGRNRTGVHGFAGRCITTLPPRLVGHRPRARFGNKLKRESFDAALPRKIWSGKRVSNSRPQPWQGCALPTELFPRKETINYRVERRRMPRRAQA